MEEYRVLLADDEEEIRTGISRKIDWAALGFALVGEAGNGEEALELAEQLRPDVVLTDIKMPFLDGLELCRRLAGALGAEVGCSRPVAENNKWLPKSSYMGITGVQVKPELILLLGVSGQIQHVGGISKSRVIVAVNKDKSAPIFKNADFGVVGDLYKVVPALIEKLS